MSRWARHVINAVSCIERKSYLEIGVSWGGTFLNVAAGRRVGVDPMPCIPGEVAGGSIHRMTSDSFFSIFEGAFDVIFIDGLHDYQQVLRDFNSSVERLAPGGMVLLHDMVPPRECYATEPHCGSAYKLYPALCGAYRESILTLQPFPCHDYHSYTGDFGLTAVFSPAWPLAEPERPPTYSEFLEFILNESPPFVDLGEFLGEVGRRTATPPASAASSASEPGGAEPS